MLNDDEVRAIEAGQAGADASLLRRWIERLLDDRRTRARQIATIRVRVEAALARVTVLCDSLPRPRPVRRGPRRHRYAPRDYIK